MDPLEEITIKFEPLENQRRVLGSSFSTLAAGPEEVNEGEGISELAISESYMVTRIRTIQSGIYDQTNAVIMICDTVFQPYAPDKYRFKSARFEISFQGQKEVLPYSSTPQILSFAPTFLGREITREEGKWGLSVGAAAGIPMAQAMLGVNASASLTRSYMADHKITIQGCTRPPSKPFRVWWTLSENKLVKGGLPHHVAFAVIVSYDGPFTVIFKSEAEVGRSSFSRSIISKKEATYMRLIEPQRELGPQFSFVGQADLKELNINARYQTGSSDPLDIDMSFKG